MINFLVQIIRQTPAGVPYLCLKQKIETEECSFIDENVILLLRYTCKFFSILKATICIYMQFSDMFLSDAEYQDL